MSIDHQELKIKDPKSIKRSIEVDQWERNELASNSYITSPSDMKSIRFDDPQKLIEEEHDTSNGSHFVWDKPPPLILMDETYSLSFLAALIQSMSRVGVLRRALCHAHTIFKDSHEVTFDNSVLYKFSNLMESFYHHSKTKRVFPASRLQSVLDSLQIYAKSWREGSSIDLMVSDLLGALKSDSNRIESKGYPIRLLEYFKLRFKQFDFTFPVSFKNMQISKGKGLLLKIPCDTKKSNGNGWIDFDDLLETYLPHFSSTEDNREKAEDFLVPQMAMDAQTMFEDPFVNLFRTFLVSQLPKVFIFVISPPLNPSDALVRFPIRLDHFGKRLYQLSSIIRRYDYLSSHFYSVLTKLEENWVAISGLNVVELDGEVNDSVFVSNPVLCLYEEIVTDEYLDRDILPLFPRLDLGNRVSSETESVQNSLDWEENSDENDEKRHNCCINVCSSTPLR